VTYQRVRVDETVGTASKGVHERPRSEVRLANEARRQVAPNRAFDGTDAARNADRVAASPPAARTLVQWGMAAFGVDELGARLPLALSAIACLIVLFVFLWRGVGLATGLIGAAVLLALPGFVLQARQLTSDMVTILAGTAAVAGLGLFLAPTARREAWTLLLGLAGLILGYLARGAVIGVLLPTVTVLVAVVAASPLHGAGPEAASRRRWTTHVIGLGLVVAAVAAVAWAALVAVGTAYSDVLGAAPQAAQRITTFSAVKEPAYQLAVFDVIFWQVGYAAFPWIALLPVALAALVFPAADPPPAELDAAALRRRYLKLLALSWLVAGVVIGTWWVLRVGELSFPALPALAAILALWLTEVQETEHSDRVPRLLAVATALLVLAILVRDLAAFPEAIPAAQLNYRLEHPAGVSFKWAFRIAAVLVGLLSVVVLLARGQTAPVTWPSGLRGWFPGSDLGLARFLGWPGQDSTRRNPSPLWVVISLALLAGAGAGMGWVVQVRPQPGPVILGALVTPYLLPLLPFVIYSLVIDPVLFAVVTSWRVGHGEPLRGLLTVLPEGEVESLRQAGRYVRQLPLAAAVLLGPAIAVVTVVSGLRIALRAASGLVVMHLLMPLVLYAMAQRRWGRVGWPTSPRMALYALIAVPLGFGAWVGHGMLPRLSAHYSYRSIIERYQSSVSRDPVKPLALHRVTTRSSVFYTKGPLISEADLRLGYPEASPLVQYLRSGWRTGDGRPVERVYAILPAKDLGQLERDTQMASPPVPYHVLDARSSFYYLVSNRLGERREGGRTVAERDENPLREVILDHAPELRCAPGDGRVCRPLQVELAERKGATEPSVEILGARFPAAFTTGKEYPMELHLAVKKKLQGKWKVFIHVDPDPRINPGLGGRIIGDHDPIGGIFDTPYWQPGRFMVDRHRIPAGSSSAVGNPVGWYLLYVGFFQGETRMTVLSGPNDGSNRVFLGRVRVQRPMGIGCGQ
jgi:4-amino-4-deoxy-L-arabinose transferase-like glycosyltransferase